MSETTHALPDWTPEQKKAICADMKQQFPVERLIEYIEDDDEKFPAEQVLAEVEQMVQKAEAYNRERKYWLSQTTLGPITQSS